MMLNLENLRRFVAVCDQGTLHRAATAIGVSQPALTRSIKLLEESVGSPLFERRARGVHPTPLGESVLAQARHLLRECQLAEAEITSHREGERGSFRIAAAPVWISAILPGVVARLHRAYPSLSIRLEALNYSEALPRLENAECDAFFGGFQRVEPLPSFLVRRATFPARLQIVARKGHPIFDRAQPVAECLPDYPWVSFQSDFAYLDTVRRVVERATGRTISAAVQCDSMLTSLELLRQGDYLSVLPSSFLSWTYGDGLTTVQPDIEEIRFDSGPIFRRSLLANAAFRRLLEEAEKRAGDLGLVP